jgi:hypothetical protein
VSIQVETSFRFYQSIYYEKTLAWTITPDTLAQLRWPIGKTWSLEAIVRVFQKEYVFEWIKIGGTMQRNH